MSFISICGFAQSIPDIEEEEMQVKVSRAEQKRAAQGLWYYQKVDQFALTAKYIKRLQDRLEKNQIIGVELVIAAPTESAVESRWGHSMMRFVDNTGTASDDVMFGFVAEVDDLKINYAKGIMGSYPTYPALQSLRLFNQQYIKDQDRPLQRIIIPTTALVRRQMVEKLVAEWNEIETKNFSNYQREITQALAKIRKIQTRKKYLKTKQEILRTESGVIYAFTLTEGENILYTVPVFFREAKAHDLGGYTFAKRNCAGALIKFLQDLKLISKKTLGWDGRVPVNLPQYFAENGLAYLPKITIPGIFELKSKILTTLNLKIEELYDFEKWPKDAASLLLNNLSLKEKLILLDTYSLFPDDVIATIKKSLPSRELIPVYEETYGIITIPELAYAACANTACAQAQLNALKIDTKTLLPFINSVRLNQERLSENYNWISQHHNSYKQLFIDLID